MRESLRGLPPPALPAGFDATLRKRLVTEAREADRRAAREGSRWSLGRWFGLGAALAAAGVAALVVGGSVLRQAPVTQPAVQDSHYRLHLSVRARGEHPAALFDVELPAGVAVPEEAVAVLGDGAVLRFEGALRRGLNEIDLPLRVRGGVAASRSVRVRLSVGGHHASAVVQLGGQRATRVTATPMVRVAWVVGADGTPERSTSL